MLFIYEYSRGEMHIMFLKHNSKQLHGHYVTQLPWIHEFPEFHPLRAFFDRNS